jgi:DNA-binding NarL/FixJ family response regulator
MNPSLVRSVLVADENHGLREGLRGLLATSFDAIVMVADEISLFESATRLMPTLAVVDISLVRGKGAQWVARLRHCCPQAKLILLSIHDEPSASRAAMAAGADGFVLKRSIGTELLTAIDAVLAGETFVSAGVHLENQALREDRES